MHTSTSWQAVPNTHLMCIAFQKILHKHPLIHQTASPACLEAYNSTEIMSSHTLDNKRSRTKRLPEWNIGRVQWVRLSWVHACGTSAAHSHHQTASCTCFCICRACSPPACAAAPAPHLTVPTHGYYSVGKMVTGTTADTNGMYTLEKHCKEIYLCMSSMT